MFLHWCSIFLILLFCTNPLDSPWPIIYVWNCILGVLVVQFNLILAGISPDWGGLVSWRSSLLFIQVFQIFSNIFKFFKYSETGLVSWRGRLPPFIQATSSSRWGGRHSQRFADTRGAGLILICEYFKYFAHKHRVDGSKTFSNISYITNILQTHAEQGWWF